MQRAFTSSNKWELSANTLYYSAVALSVFMNEMDLRILYDLKYVFFYFYVAGLFANRYKFHLYKLHRNLYYIENFV